MTTEDLAPANHWTSVVSLWVVSAVAALLVGIFATSEDYLDWLGIVMAGIVVLAMCVQLGTQEKQGFVIRFGASLAGSLVVLAIASGVLFLVHL